MNKNLTDITVVMDRSGSMGSIKSDAEGGLNQFVEDQKKQAGDANFTLVHFDHEYEFVHRGVPIKDVPKYELVPRGNTALLDAVGRAIVETGERLGKVPDADKPALVVFVILTDGEENASKEYTKAKVKEMVRHQAETYNWQFTYLGANQDAFAEADGMGIKTNAAANFVGRNADKAYKGASRGITAMRCSAMAEAVIDCDGLSYTDAERADMASANDAEKWVQK